MPADVAPAFAEKKPGGRSTESLIDRLGENVRTSPLTQVRAALYLHKRGDRDLAAYLGVVEAYDGITRVRAEAAAGSAAVTEILAE